ncbi:DUF1542 domain-containing protein [Corynebacterium breve]|uniref:DUF1542 domain-containing protein n=1 Tax=Corynebacterium breve TaxID=3049799 RepID=A0ABY8VCH9_9CORY|nr:DUF1542 domain-containing protein [Corynebacterium breve]WIM67198.1 DUF1542 domain-containing protein [Corynebacterium breve]
MSLLILLAIAGGAVWFLSSRNNQKKQLELDAVQFEDAKADAQRWVDRLGSQVLNISGSDAASTQAMADASERFNAAASALSTASTAKQAQLARESALEGMHYVNAAREIMGMTPGPQLPELEGQRRAGKVTERRTIQQENGTTLTASPYASAETPNYYPGGNVAGRPVPAGWYSEPWWASAMLTGMWSMSSMMMFSAMFSGMAGTPTAEEFEAGDMGDAAGDMGDMGDAGDMGDMGDAGGDMGDMGGGFDLGGGDFGGFDF